MDTHTDTEHLEMMRNPSRWPWRTFLPLVHKTEDRLAILTIRLHDDGVTFAILRDANMLLTSDPPAVSEAITPEQALLEGWRVD